MPQLPTGCGRSHAQGGTTRSDGRMESCSETRQCGTTGPEAGRYERGGDVVLAGVGVLVDTCVQFGTGYSW